ncbi:MAG: hypothetical protein PHN92_02540 [Geobacter sp.]|nr:hypothetical protein [Geobacter sp.]
MNLSAENSKPERERFSRPAAVVGIIAGFLLLLIFLYPEQTLHRMLSKEGHRTAAGRSYLVAALRMHPGDHQLRLVLAQAWLSIGCYQKALAVLDGFPAVVPVPIRQQADQLRYGILREQLLDVDDNSVARDTFRGQAYKLLQAARLKQEIDTIEYDATSLALPELVTAAQQRRKLLYPTAIAINDGKQPGVDSYRQTASVAFAAMAKATTTAERRASFLKAVLALQSGNLVQEALYEGERHLAPLAQDQESLMVMTRIALAAGKPDKAQHFIRRALGMSRPS